MAFDSELKQIKFMNISAYKLLFREKNMGSNNERDFEEMFKSKKFIQELT